MSMEKVLDSWKYLPVGSAINFLEKDKWEPLTLESTLKFMGHLTYAVIGAPVAAALLVGVATGQETSGLDYLAQNSEVSQSYSAR